MKSFAHVGAELTDVAALVDGLSMALLVHVTEQVDDPRADPRAERIAMSIDLSHIAAALRRQANRSIELGLRYDPAPGELVELYGS